MSKHAAVLKRIKFYRPTFDEECRVGEFVISNISKKVYDNYRNAFLKVYKDNPEIIAENSDAHGSATHAFYKSCRKAILLGDEAVSSEFTIHTVIIPETKVIDAGGNNIAVEDFDKLLVEEINVDVELRVGLCETSDRNRVRFIVDNLIVKS